MMCHQEHINHEVRVLRAMQTGRECTLAFIEVSSRLDRLLVSKSPFLNARYTGDQDRSSKLFDNWYDDLISSCRAPGTNHPTPQAV